MNLYEKYEQATREYLASLKFVTPSKETYDKYAFILGNFGEYVKGKGGDETEIDPLLIVGWRNEIKETRGLANNSMRHYLTLLHSFFKWTIEHKIFTEQPVGNADFPKKEAVEYDLLTEQEIEKILSGTIPPASMKSTCLRDRAIVFLFLTSGVRVSELINLCIGDLDFRKNILTVRHGKGDKKRYVPFPPFTRQIIKDYLNARYGANKPSKSTYLFEYVDDGGTEHQYTRQYITQTVKRYVFLLTGHKNIGSHDLRHSYASYLLTKDVPIQKIQLMLGHSNYSTTFIYASQLCPERVAADLNSIFPMPSGIN